MGWDSDNLQFQTFFPFKKNPQKQQIRKGSTFHLNVRVVIKIAKEYYSFYLEWNKFLKTGDAGSCDRLLERWQRIPLVLVYMVTDQNSGQSKHNMSATHVSIK